VVSLLCALAGLGPQGAQGAVRSCNPVLNPYPGTRYDDSDLRRIRAVGVTCRGAAGRRQAVPMARVARHGRPPG
jgi:hypothetical protein